MGYHEVAPPFNHIYVSMPSDPEKEASPESVTLPETLESGGVEIGGQSNPHQNPDEDADNIVGTEESDNRSALKRNANKKPL